MRQYKIVHSLPGRLRVRFGNYAFSSQKAIALKYTIQEWENVNGIEVNDVTGSLLFYYEGNEEDLLEKLDVFDVLHFDEGEHLDLIEQHSYELQQKEVSQYYVEEFGKLIVRRYLTKWFVPLPFQKVLSIARSFKYLKSGIRSLAHGHIGVPVLDATSISVSMMNKDFSTARNIMFLLSISELLEDYTRKKTSLQLKENLSFNVDKVWVKNNGAEFQIPMAQLKLGDVVVMRMGSMIPIDGEVVNGEAMINESSFTGEPLSKAVKAGSSVFAGTIVEEGKIDVKVKTLQSESRMSKIVDMIDTNESLKAGIQSKAEHLADAIVPFSFLSFFALLLATRNLTRASSVLLVDYSCAIKLSTSISIISTMQEASRHSIMVKGGKYLEAMAEADTIVFDKTGTLTNASPCVQEVIPLDEYSREEVLKIAACIEEHFPHSVANAIVKEAQNEGLSHDEFHAEVKYIIAHGIETQINGVKAVIGSEHFIFEDEGIERTEKIDQIVTDLQNRGCHSLVYLAIGERLAGIISIYDPLKDEAKQVVEELRNVGFEHIVMLTGDCENAAKFIADELGIKEYKANVLPEDKADYIKKLKATGRKVVMVGDGVNDTPALSQSDVSISMQDSSAMARELADVTLISSRLDEIVVLKKLSLLTMERIRKQYRYIVMFNSLLIAGGFVGIFSPSTSALLHNTSTFAFAANSTRSLLK